MDRNDTQARQMATSYMIPQVCNDQNRQSRKDRMQVSGVEEAGSGGHGLLMSSICSSETAPKLEHGAALN